MLAARNIHRSQARSRLFHRNDAVVDHTSPKSLELYLASRGLISTDDMMRVMALSQRQEASQADILTQLEILDETDLARIQAQRLGERFLELEHDPPNPDHIRRWGAAKCLKTGVMPWRMRNGYTVVATAQPQFFDRYKQDLEMHFGPVRRAIATDADIRACVETVERHTLTERAESRVDDLASCRTLDYAKWRIGLFIVAAFAIFVLFMSPKTLFVVCTIWAIAALVLNTGLKLATVALHISDPFGQKQVTENPPQLARMPRISIMVPLFKEREIVAKLIERLQRLSYPKELLDVHLVVEEDDETTQDTISRTRMPIWMKMQTVPAGGLKTKPRALNYALDHCKGSIIGVYDAEDAPDPYQLKRIVRRFSERGPEVVCLQGVLDFYNPKANWLARCFAVEYATWFRIILPGLERLGLAVPLGGTTLFFRRAALEELGAWDAHNVTEDADLGIRLARHGYRTELVPTVTLEEANCRPWPWVKQRSRWLKGYAITWAVHMRNPRALWNDLGAWRFFGVQVLFLGTISGFVLAPLLWSFWLIPLGLPHPLDGILPSTGFWALGAVFALSELITIATGCLAVTAPQHRHLMKWVPTLHLYFPLAALASYKALWELVTKPFFWDKTAHGLSEAETEIPEDAPILQPRVLDVSQKPDLNAVSQLHTQLLRRGSQLR